MRWIVTVAGLCSAAALLAVTTRGALSAGATIKPVGPELQTGFKLQADGKDIDDPGSVGHFVPTVADWNGDGKKDLIVGSFTGDPGNVRLYTNIGTDAEPKFGKVTFMEANGQPIKLTGG
jgi:hypothetical protein